MKHFYDPRTSTTSSITRSDAGLAKNKTMRQHQEEPHENSPKNTNAQKDGVRGSGGLVSLCCGTTRGFRSRNQDPSDSRHEQVTVYRENEARHVGLAAPSGTVNHERSTKTPHEPRVSPPPLMIPRIMGPPKIHRITSSSPRPSLTYERIGNPCLGIFKLSLPRRLTQTLHGIVGHAENHVAMTHPNGSWKTELYSVTRQDVALRKIPGMSTRIEPIVDYITRAMQALYGCHRVHMDRNQPHILKYSVDTGHTGGRLPHVDILHIVQEVVYPLTFVRSFVLLFVYQSSIAS